MALPEHLKVGLRGEQLAARYLRSKKYQIFASNFSTKLGETDIIAIEKGGTVCFVEVKTRSPGQMFAPSEAVDFRKQENLRSNAAAFLKTAKLQERNIRFDIIEVILHDLYTADINHIKNAF
ncbi:MAG: YraN family protein [Clostridia bacterium]|nr:YraN family protein [Clostridia bacterium]